MLASNSDDRIVQIDSMEILARLAESAEISQDEAECAARTLLQIATISADSEVREAALHALAGLVDSYRLRDVPWDDLVAALGGFDNQSLAHAIYVLGGTLEERYLPVVEKFIGSNDREIRDTSRHAADVLMRVL